MSESSAENPTLQELDSNASPEPEYLGVLGVGEEKHEPVVGEYLEAGEGYGEGEGEDQGEGYGGQYQEGDEGEGGEGRADENQALDVVEDGDQEQPLENAVEGGENDHELQDVVDQVDEQVIYAAVEDTNEEQNIQQQQGYQIDQILLTQSKLNADNQQESPNELAPQQFSQLQNQPQDNKINNITPLQTHPQAITNTQIIPDPSEQTTNQLISQQVQTNQISNSLQQEIGQARPQGLVLQQKMEHCQQRIEIERIRKEGVDKQVKKLDGVHKQKEEQREEVRESKIDEGQFRHYEQILRKEKEQQIKVEKVQQKGDKPMDQGQIQGGQEKNQKKEEKKQGNHQAVVERKQIEIESKVEQQQVIESVADPIKVQKAIQPEKKKKKTKKVIKKQDKKQQAPIPPASSNNPQKQPPNSQAPHNQPLKTQILPPTSSSLGASPSPAPEPQLNPPNSQNLLPQPPSSLIIRQAQKQRIGTTLTLFLAYNSKFSLHNNNHKSVLMNIYAQIDRKKALKYVWYHLVSEYLMQYQQMIKDHQENSYKIYKQEQTVQKNKHLNIGEELKQATDQLTFLRKDVGNRYLALCDVIEKKIMAEMEVCFNSYIQNMNKAQAEANEKKNTCIQIEEQLRKNIQKLTKIYNRGREGKKQDEDVFVETCKFIQLERMYRNSLVAWGQVFIGFKKRFVELEQKLSEDIQQVLNNFKNVTTPLYSFHEKKFTQITSSKQQILKQNKFSKLCTLADSDYIKYAIETATKNPIPEVQDKDYEYFSKMGYFQFMTGKSTDLLKGMINKKFQLRAQNEQLINTISGNLVHFNMETSEYKDKFMVKNLSATIVSEGVVQFEEVIPGIFFSDNRTIRLSFVDQDRAEELICLLNEKV